MKPVIGQPHRPRDGRAQGHRPRQIRRRVRIAGCRARRPGRRARSPSGAIAGFDLAGAQSAPGVLAILTHRERAAAAAAAAEPARDDAGVDRVPLLQDDKVHYNGQHDRAGRRRHPRARAARRRAGQCALPRRRGADPRWRDALGDAYPPKHFRNGARPPDSRRGDPEAALRSAADPARPDATRRRVENHNPMEPHATIALWDGDRLTRLRRDAGHLRRAQQTLADAVRHQAGERARDLPVRRRRLRLQGLAWPHVALAAMAARQVGRPVKLVLTRPQMFALVGYRPADRCSTSRSAPTHDGRLTAHPPRRASR